MTVELIVPTLGESITEATVSKWLKKVGEPFDIDEPLVEIETDKITVEVPAPQAGSLSEIKAKEGSDIHIGGVLGIIGDSNGSKKTQTNETKNIEPKKEKIVEQNIKDNKKINKNNNKLSPSVKKMLVENNLDASSIKTQRDDGRITKEDILNHLEGKNSLKKQKSTDREEIVPMSKIRQTIATRLKESQNTAAILTTFNESPSP